MDMMEYRHKAMAYLGPLPAFSTLAGEEEIYGVSSEGAPVKVCSKRLLEAVMGLLCSTAMSLISRRFCWKRAMFSGI